MKSRVIFSGGLGNQMFEYTFLLFLKEKGIEAVINTNLYQYMIMHNGYLLDKVFGIARSPFWGDSKLASLFIRALVKYKPSRLLCSENGFGDADFNKYYKKRWPFYFGCWINPYCFDAIKEQIRESFAFKDVDERNAKIALELNSVNSVSIHIRRGDYLKIPRYAVCDESYYTNAINYMLNHVENPFFYVFSDDVSWSEGFMKQFDVSFKVISHNQGSESYKDMYLMTQCRNNIIANSTFSWWGAWLNNYSNRIVVCRSVWIKGQTFNPCLPEWIHI